MRCSIYFSPRGMMTSLPQHRPIRIHALLIVIRCVHEHNLVRGTRNKKTFTNAEGKLRSWASGGLCGFKHSRRGEYEAGYQCAVRIFKNIEALMETESFKLELIYKGFGQGRQALDSALLTTEGDKIRPLICRLTDRTPLKFGGTRARKARRL